MARKESTAEPPEPLAKYWAKRNFDITAEPQGEHASGSQGRSFVVQKHAARSLHYDFRLELDGVLVSWAVPKGPSYDPADKRMAIHVEDHPLSYGSFEGTIPAKQYGAGTVIVWDNGTWEPVDDPTEGLVKGKLAFKLNGQKLMGLWELVRIAKTGDKQDRWILFKKRDAFVRSKTDYDVVTALPDSVIAKPIKKAAATARTRRSATKSKGSRPGTVPGAVKAALPQKLQPQLATLATGIPNTGEWKYEIKFDGYRIMTRIEGGKASLITRGGHDWSSKMPQLMEELQKLGVKSAWLDGEIVVLDEEGMPSFNRLQKSFDRKSSAAGISYFLFDIPFFEGYDLRQVSLVERRSLLKALLEAKGTEHVRYSADFEGNAASVLESACQMRMEGVIAKRADAPYSSRRTETWLKLKCKLRQEFVVAGYTDRSDGSAQIGSLLLGVYEDSGELVSVGSVGTGWDAAEAADLKKKLSKIETPKPPFAAGVAKPGRWSKRVAGSERWVKPKLVAEVEYSEMTPDGQIRHASYVSLRSDRAPSSVHREMAKSPGTGTSTSKSRARARAPPRLRPERPPASRSPTPTVSSTPRRV